MGRESSINNMKEQDIPESKTSEEDKNGNLRGLVTRRLDSLGIMPNESLGQHFLVDQASIDLLSNSIIPGNTVFEVGPGIGQLTEAFAQKASKVIAVEIDRRYEPVLNTITRRYPNVKVVFGDAIAVGPKILAEESGEETQIVANLPFHITEPFLRIIAKFPIDSATLVVGQRLVHEVRASNEDSADFGKLTLLAQAFFDIDILAAVEKHKFFPVPRSDSAIIRLTPKEEHEFRSSRRDFLLRRLFLAKKNPLVKNCLKEGLIEFEQVRQMGTRSKKEHNQRVRSSTRAELKKVAEEYNHSEDIPSIPHRAWDEELKQPTQNQARTIIEKMGIPQELSNKTFDRLSNYELRILSKALRNN